MEAHTDEARHKYDMMKSNMEDNVDLASGFMVLYEELGKLVRTCAKLRDALDETTVQHWRKERHHRFVTSVSVLERLYLIARERDA